MGSKDAIEMETRAIKRKTKEQISFNMSRVKCKDSDIELALRAELRERGIHYRKNVRRIFGNPDIAFVGLKIAVFCDSEFWHGFDWEHRKEDFKSNKEFWFNKIERNMARDREVNEHLESEGWTVLRFWGKEIKNNAADCADVIEKAIKEKRNV